jgi:hypothetical protein
MGSAASLCTRALDPIDSDHLAIVKPDSEDSPSYLAFKAAYADARIPALRHALDNQTSVRLASEIAELVRFPNAVEASPPPTLLERLLNYKLPHRIFDVLAHYNKSEILAVPDRGEMLDQFKLDYYDFEIRARAWEEELTTKIGTKVAVRFRAGWLIYLQYVILRDFGNSKDKIIAQGNFLNFDITWEDAERVFNEVSSDQLVAQGTSDLKASWEKVLHEAMRLAEKV